jgi:predicted adenylyl cyclase CyaB
MPANLELKARCPDLAATRLRADAVATEWLGVDRQVDTYFRAPGGRLKLRESSLSGGQLIPYLRPDQRAARRSDYVVIPIPEAERTKALLSELLGVHRVVRKRREIALYQNVRIHLDQVEGLGDFVELEAVWDGDVAGEARQAAKVAFLREQLHIVDADLVPLSYEGLLEEASPA